jgi:fluoride exporter
MTGFLAVAVGSALGGVVRHWVNVGISRRTESRFPWGTLAVNVTGAWLAGALVALLTGHIAGKETEHMLLIVGFCGAYTTVSTFSLQTLERLQDRDHAGAILNIAASVVGTLAGAATGLWCGALLA